MSDQRYDINGNPLAEVIHRRMRRLSDGASGGDGVPPVPRLPDLQAHARQPHRLGCSPRADEARGQGGRLVTPPVPGQHNHAEPCRCVYPNACFCTPQQKALRDPGLDPPGQHNHAAETAEALREEWEALALISYSGDGHGGWVPDLGRDDIEAIRRTPATCCYPLSPLRRLVSQKQNDNETRRSVRGKSAPHSAPERPRRAGSRGDSRGFGGTRRRSTETNRGRSHRLEGQLDGGARDVDARPPCSLRGRVRLRPDDGPVRVLPGVR